MLHYRHTLLLRFKTENFYSKLCFWKRRQWRHKKSFTRFNVKSSLFSFFAKFANPSLVLERLLLLASYSFIHAHWLTSPTVDTCSNFANTTFAFCSEVENAKQKITHIMHTLKQSIKITVRTLVSYHICRLLSPT